MKPISLLVLTALLVALSPIAWAGEGREKPTPREEEKIPELEGDPSDHYFEGYLIYKEGEKLQKDGKLEGAQTCLQRALGKFKGVRKKWPDWKQETVGNRIRVTEEMLKSLEKEDG